MTPGNSLTVLRRAAAYMGQPYDSIDTETFGMLVSFFGHRLVELWELAEWPDLVHLDRRLVAQAWRYGDSYVVGEGRYHGATDQYWQVIDPGGVNGTEEPGISPKWQRILRDYNATDWDPEETYTYGDQVFWPFSQNTYAYINSTDAAGVVPTETSHWRLLVKGAGDFPLEDVLEAAPTMGTVFRVSPDDPKAYDVEAEALEFTLTPDGVRVQGDPGSAWFRYRERAPRITGLPWDTATTYEAGEQVYRASGSSAHFYTALTSSAAAAPEANDAAWERIEWPEVFESALAMAIHADWLRMDGQHDKATRAEGMYLVEQERLLAVLYRQQRQAKGVRVMTR